MPLWIIYAILGGLASTMANFLHRKLLKEGDDPTAYAWFYETFLLIAACIYAIFNFRIEFTIQTLFALGGLGMVEFISVYFYMKMHSYSHLSISTIISRARMIWVAIITYVMFGETLSIIQYMGMAILFIGLACVTSPKKLFADKGLSYAYITSIGTAFVNVFIKLSTVVASTPIVMASMTIPSVVLFPLLIKNPQQRLIETCKVNLHLKILAGVANVASSFFLVLAMTEGSTTIVATLYQSMMIVGVLAGIVLLHEKEDIRKKIIGALITIIGIIMLTT